MLRVDPENSVVCPVGGGGGGGGTCISKESYAIAT